MNQAELRCIDGAGQGHFTQRADNRDSGGRGGFCFADDVFEYLVIPRHWGSGD